MNLSGFSIPEQGRWALDPSFGSLEDSIYDIDNDTLQNSLEAPDRWDTNPVDDDSDGDRLPDGWEVSYSEEAIALGLVDNNTLNALGSRGPMDPRMPDSDLDGINDDLIDEVVSSHVPQLWFAIASTQMVLGINVHHLVYTQSDLLVLVQ